MYCSNAALHLGGEERHRHQQPLALDGRQHELHQFLERAHLRPAQFVDRAALRIAVDRFGNRRGDVADEHRLEAGRAAADQRQRRRDARQRGEAVEEIVLRPEHDRRPHDDGLRQRGQHQAARPRPWSARRRAREFSSAPIAETCTSRAPCALRRQRHLLGAVGVHGVEALAAALEQDADQIDQHVGVARRGFHRRARCGDWPAPRGSGRRGRAAADGRRAPAGAPPPGCGSRAGPARAPHGGRGSRSRHRR